MSEREKEKEKLAETIDKGLVSVDWSAEERFYNRSRKIRRRIWRWLYDHRGSFFETEEDLSAECANFAKCSSVTARRWIHQFSRPNSDFHIQDTETGYIIWFRPEMKELGNK